MITRAQIETAMRTWLVDALGGGVTVIFADQAAPRPDPPYATCKVMGPRSVGHDDRRAIDDDGLQDMVGDRVITVSVQVFGDGAVDNARTAANALNKEAARAKLATVGIAPRGGSAINELTALLEVGAEERAQFDAQFGFADEYTDDVGLIERVEGEGTIDAPAEHTIDFEAEKPGYSP